MMDVFFLGTIQKPVSDIHFSGTGAGNLRTHVISVVEINNCLFQSLYQFNFSKFLRRKHGFYADILIKLNSLILLC
jgi:hypothetical protein